MDKLECPEKAEEVKQKVCEAYNVEAEVSSFLDNLLKPKVLPTKKSKEKEKTVKENPKCESCSFRGRSSMDLKKQKEAQHKEQNHPITKFKADVGVRLPVDSQMETRRLDKTSIVT